MQASSLPWVEFVTELSVEECRAGGASTIFESNTEGHGQKL